MSFCDAWPTSPAAFGPFRLFPTARRLERDGIPVELGGRALDVLTALVSQAGRVVSRTDLMSSVWPDTAVIDGALRVHICNLRKALGDSVNGARYITSVAGRGYWQTDAASPSPSPGPGPSGAAAARDIRGGSPRRR